MTTKLEILGGGAGGQETQETLTQSRGKGSQPHQSRREHLYGPWGLHAHQGLVLV